MEQFNNEIIFFVFLLGIIVGSFLNCLIWRVYKSKSIRGRSSCPHCGQMIRWSDNIPIFSYLFLRGKCRSCQNTISIQYPLVEFVSGLLFVCVFILHSYSTSVLDVFLVLGILKDWFIISVLIFVFVFDLRWYLIPDKVILPSMAIILIFNLILGGDWLDLAISAIIGSGFFLIQFLISRGKWIGGGDIRLGLFLGLALGEYRLTILTLFLAYFIGGMVALGLLATGKKTWSQKIPFGIFLTVATVVALFWGENIVVWYLGLLIN